MTSDIKAGSRSGSNYWIISFWSPLKRVSKCWTVWIIGIWLKNSLKLVCCSQVIKYGVYLSDSESSSYVFWNLFSTFIPIPVYWISIAIKTCLCKFTAKKKEYLRQKSKGTIYNDLWKVMKIDIVIVHVTVHNLEGFVLLVLLKWKYISSTIIIFKT